MIFRQLACLTYWSAILAKGLRFRSDAHLATQFQLQGGAENILPAIKAVDATAMMQLLSEKISENQPNSQAVPYVITDVGCGPEPKMLQYFFQSGLWLRVNALEPWQPSLMRYKKALFAKRRIAPGLFFNNTLQDANFHRLKYSSDLTLCSHSLYYSKEHWENPSVPLSEHLFTKLLHTLKEKGCLCVVLQSEDGSLSPGGRGTHAELENITYPIMFRIMNENKRQHQEHGTYTNAEIFRKAMTDYMERLKEQAGIELDILSSVSVTQIALGNVNFNLDANGKYSQSDPRAKAILMFYTKQHYDSYTPEEQKQLLDFIQARCQTAEDNYLITHVNSVFVITSSQKIPSLRLGMS